MAEGGVIALTGGEQRVKHAERARFVASGDGVREFVQGTLLCGQHHGFHVAERDVLFLSDIENQFFQFMAYEHHVRAQRINQFAASTMVSTSPSVMCFFSAT